MEVEDPQAAEETAAPTSPTVTKMEAPEEESPSGDAVMKTEPQEAQSTPQEEFTPKSDADLHKVKRGRVTKMEYRKMSLAERKEEKKLFVQSRLRRMIAPKPPCQILKELVGAQHVQYNTLGPQFSEDSPGESTMIACEVIIHGKTFQGSAPSPDLAANMAAETAIQALVMQMVQAGIGTGTEPADLAPWPALASLAIFKMFNDWNSRTGFTLPVPAHSNPPRAPVSLDQPRPAPQPSKMPQDPASKHPAMLVNELHPAAEFSITQVGGPCSKFTIQVEIDGQSFEGEGKSKKEAKKACCMSALKSIHGIEYPV